MPPATPQHETIDLRLYLGMVFFRWQIIAVCFLYCLLGGVIYIHMTPKEYITSCSVMNYRDPNSMVGGGNPFASYGTQRYLFQSGKLRSRVVNRLADKWSRVVGGQGRMMLGVVCRQGRQTAPTLDVSTRSVNPSYAEAFLTALLEEHRTEWQSMQMENASAAMALLDKELAQLEEKIRAAEDEVIEYQRLHDVWRMKLRGSDEASYLAALVGHRRKLLTQLMMMEYMTPALKGENEEVIRNFAQLTKETGEVGPEITGETAAEAGEEGTGGEGRGAANTTADRETPAPAARKPASNKTDVDESRAWSDVRVNLARLRMKEQELLTNMTEDHPQVKDVRRQIQAVQNQLKLAAELELERLRDRHRALSLELAAIEAAEYKWQAKHLFASQRQGELRRISTVVSRYEGNYRSLFDRLHAIKVSEELKVERYSVVSPVSSDTTPVWPDPMRILLVAVVLGLGSGFGIALVSHILDNKIQSIKDVEKELGVPYLGGVPFWVHSGLERTIRPIVTEEHSTGAVEAYRALRTTIVAALNKINERIFFITSADSKEGKTLTALNICIMIAQMNKKVLLVDMDLRRGRLHRSLGMEKEPGVSDVLKEGLALRDVIRKTKVANLYLAPTGSSIEDSAELLQSSDLMNMLVELQNEYDYICVDTSPILRVTDTAVVATQGVGVLVYVARVNHTPKPLIRYSLEMLKDARVLGLIMNSIEMHRVSSLYYTYQYPNYAYYSNAYAYGYNYYYYGDGQDEGGEQRREGRRKRRRPSLAQWLRRTFLPMS